MLSQLLYHFLFETYSPVVNKELTDSENIYQYLPSRQVSRKNILEIDVTIVISTKLSKL